MARDSSRSAADANLPFVSSLKELESEHGEGADRYVVALFGRPSVS